MTPPDVESISWLRFAFASFTVLTLLAALAWGLKYATANGWLSPNASRTKRLKLVSALSLDARRRIVLVEKDDKEYTILVGGSSDVLLDTSTCGTKANDNASNKETASS